MLTNLGMLALFEDDNDVFFPSVAIPANSCWSSAEVVKLWKAGVGNDVMLAFIQKSRFVFNLSVNDILYLKDAGIPSPIITAMLNHDGSLRSQNPGGPALNAPNQPPVPVQPDYPGAPPPVVMDQAPPPVPMEVVPVAPGPDYYWAPDYWGWNNGWGWRGGGWRIDVGLGWGGYWSGFRGSWGGYHGGALCLFVGNEFAPLISRTGIFARAHNVQSRFLAYHASPVLILTKE